MSLPIGLRREVIRRAKGRCEYCRLSQIGQEATFHIDHIQPIIEDGATDLQNLALACVSCSLRKGARRDARDPLSGTTALLFHPRQQSWSDHFRWKFNRITGLTPTGRATIELLKMNRSLALAIRAEERLFHRHPP